jgi:hypothetical protein
MEFKVQSLRNVAQCNMDNLNYQSSMLRELKDFDEVTLYVLDL